MPKPVSDSKCLQIENNIYLVYTKFAKCFPQLDSSSIKIDPNAQSMKGSPVSGGLVAGPARVIKDFLTEAHLIKKGDILITRATDTGKRSTIHLSKHPFKSEASLTHDSLTWLTGMNGLSAPES